MIRKKFIFVYLLFVLYLFVRVHFKLEFHDLYTYYINPFSHLFILIFVYLWRHDFVVHARNINEKFKTTLIIFLLYLIIYLTIGIFTGYAYSIYSHKYIAILKNFYSIVLVVIMGELIRGFLVKSASKDFINYIVITLLFVFLDINFKSLDLKTASSIFEFIVGTFISLIMKHAFFTYLIYKNGYKSALLFRLIMETAYILLPIIPNMDWFVKAMFDIIAYAIMLGIVRFESIGKELRENQRNIKKENPLHYLPFLVFIVFFICFTSGMFKYMPLGVMSDSMKPKFARGAMVVVRKLDEDGIKKLKVGDIIEYKLDNYIVIHRIIEIKNISGKLFFKLKGDNNNAPDKEYVPLENVLAKVYFNVPFIGYPSVWLAELFTNIKPEVETGN
jgi:signal peptidase